MGRGSSSSMRRTPARPKAGSAAAYPRRGPSSSRSPGGARSRAYLKAGQTQPLVLRVDDAPRAFKLEGKQGYGNARGIWQTPYLEARGAVPLRLLHFSPDVDRKRVVVTAGLLEKAPRELTLTLRFKNATLPSVTRRVPRGA